MQVQTNKKSWFWTSETLSHAFVCAILLLFFAGYFIDLEQEISLVAFILFSITTFILVLRYKQLLLYAISFLVPLSVQVNVAGNARVSLPVEMMCVLLSLFLFVQLILGKRPDRGFLKHPITVFILLDLAWLFFSALLSEMPEVSLKRVTIRLFYYATFYYFFFELFKLSAANIRRVFILHTAGFLVPIVYAMIKHYQLGFTTMGSQQISAPFYFDHTIYGACLVFFIPFLIHATSDRSYPLIRRAALFILPVFICAAYFSYSRAAWISILAAMGVYVVLKYKIPKKWLLYAGLIVIAGILINMKRIDQVLKQNKDISHTNNIGMHFKSISNVNTDASNKERINRWKCALRMFADKPLAGFGPGTYQFFYGSYQQRSDLTRISTFNGTKGHAHSEYLNYLSETGLPGLLIFLSLSGVVFYTALRAFRRATEKETKDVLLFLITGLITFYIHAFFNGFLEFDKMAMPVFCAFAAIISLDLKHRESSRAL